MEEIAGHKGGIFKVSGNLPLSACVGTIHACRKSDCLGCAVLLCLVSLLASFFLPSHLSFKNMYILGLVFGIIGGFITPAFSFILS